MSRRRLDAGQAAVELALTLPLVLVMLLGVVQVLVIVRAQIAVTHAAREGARAGAVAADSAAAASAAARGAVTLTLLQISTTESAGRVRTEVSARVPTDIPIIGAFVGDVSVRAVAVMAVEP